jgi:LysR family transcriptional regulator, nitrogen assimilation regulatory protein
MAMKLQQLRTFVAICQENSFTVAAKRIHATQSGLSMQIKDLEDFLGVKLLERTAAGVAPTLEGRKFYERVASILRDLSTAEDELRSMNSELTGSLTVGVMPTFSRSALPTVLNEFSGTYPHVDLKIIEAFSSVLTQAVISGEVDFAIVPPEKARKGIRVKKVATDLEVFASGTNSSRQHLEPISLHSAGPLKLVMPSTGNSRRTSLDSYLATTGAQVKDVIELDGMMGTLDFIAQSDWVAILPGTLCFPDLSGRVRKLHPITDPPLSVDYVLIESDTQALSPAAKIFSEMLIQNINEICTEVERCVSD